MWLFSVSEVARPAMWLPEFVEFIIESIFHSNMVGLGKLTVVFLMLLFNFIFYFTKNEAYFSNDSSTGHIVFLLILSL